jgi:hypothetical protein
VKPEQLRQEIDLELELIESTVRELASLQRDLAGRQPTVRETTAAAAFLAQFYNGLENILKRISRFYDVPLPQGETWHLDLFDRFCSPPYEPLPALFNRELAAQLAPFRKFRHVVYHSYGFDLDWERMAEGIAGVERIFAEVKAALQDRMILSGSL